MHYDNSYEYENRSSATSKRINEGLRKAAELEDRKTKITLACNGIPLVAAILIFICLPDDVEYIYRFALILLVVGIPACALQIIKIKAISSLH